MTLFSPWFSSLFFSVAKDSAAREPHVHPGQCFTQHLVLDVPPRSLQASRARLLLREGLRDGDKGKAMPAKLFHDFLCGYSTKIREDGERGRGSGYKSSPCPRFLHC